MDLLSFLLGLLVAMLIAAVGFGWWLGRRTEQAFAAGRDSQAGDLARTRAEAEHRQTQLAELRGQLAETQAELRTQTEANTQAGRALATAQAQIAALEPLRDQLLANAAEAARLQQALAAAEARYAAQSARIEEQTAATSEKLAFIDHARSQLADQFQALANAILEQKSERFAAQNIEQVGRILEPLREQIRVFQTEVGEARRQEGEHHVLLHKELDNLRGANQKLGAEAANLIHALRGDSRAQGTWGELVLERLLESAGLESGREFETQLVINDHEQSRKRPDV
ncbi:MAG: DNA recombination protein RmuC, partial [Lysobacterales bacterium]